MIVLTQQLETKYFSQIYQLRDHEHRDMGSSIKRNKDKARGNNKQRAIDTIVQVHTRSNYCT